MKTSTSGLLVAVLFGAGTLAAQAQSSEEPDSLKRLRQIIAEQKQNPDKIIREATNSSPAEAKNAAAGQTIAPTNALPLRPPLEFKPAPPPAPPTGTKAAAAELERQYLNGKISERKYKKALAELENAAKAPPSVAKPKPEPPTEATTPKPSPSQVVATPTTPAPPPQPAANQKRVSEVEAKLDDMIRQKEARESAAKTNAPPAPGAKLTKRQRMDYLLRQLIDGKLSDAEYKKEREKILAEPEEGKQ